MAEPDFDIITEEASATVTYIGEGGPGRETSAAIWRIRKREVVGGDTVEVSYADNSTKFDKVWDDRSSYNFRS